MNAKRKAIYDRTGGRCYYCGTPLEEKGWHADHVEAIRRNWWTNTCLNPENDTESNKVPACASCNLQKGPLTVEQFREKIALFINSLNKYHNQYIVAKRYGLVQETGAPVEFWFERQQRPQAQHRMIRAKIQRLGYKPHKIGFEEECDNCRKLQLDTTPPEGTKGG